MFSNICKLFFIFLMPVLFINAQEKKTIVFVGEIKQNIDPRTNRYTKLFLEKAKEKDVDIIIIELDTYGGAVNDADDIRTMILDYNKPIYVWINKDAASAGALISIACDSIYMSSGASIGAATVVTPDGAAAPDKYQSYMRSIMRSTAEAKNRDPKIAEAMVDEKIQVDSISQEGEVITFSTNEAIENGFCEAELNSIEEILKRNNIENYKVEKYELSSTENIISLFLNPIVSSILILLIIGGLYFELQTPGIGFPIMASIVALILYLTPYYLNGLAENWEIFLFLIGMIFIIIEVFVIPGFGVAGIFGLALTIGSLMLLMLNNDVFDFTFVVSKDILNASGSILIAVLGFGILLFFGGIKFTESQAFKRVMLEDTQDLDKGYISRKYSDKLIGKSGKAMTILRPSGKITISDKIYDATTSGEYIEKNSKIIVLSNEGSTLKVKKS